MKEMVYVSVSVFTLGLLLSVASPNPVFASGSESGGGSTSSEEQGGDSRTEKREELRKKMKEKRSKKCTKECTDSEDCCSEKKDE